MKKYFEQYQAPDFAYWALLEIETLVKEHDQFCSYENEAATGNLILHGSGIKIIVPIFNDRVFNEISNEERKRAIDKKVKPYW